MRKTTKLTASLANPCCSSEINKAILEMWNEIVSVICNNNFNGGNKKSRKTTQTSSSYLPASELNEMFTLLIEFSWYTSRQHNKSDSALENEAERLNQKLIETVKITPSSGSHLNHNLECLKQERIS